MGSHVNSFAHLMDNSFMPVAGDYSSGSLLEFWLDPVAICSWDRSSSKTEFVLEPCLAWCALQQLMDRWRVSAEILSAPTRTFNSVRLYFNPQTGACIQEK